MKDRDRDVDTGMPPDPVTPKSEPSPEKSAFPWKVAGGGGLALLLIWFVLQNSHSVEVNLFWWSGAYPMILLLAGVAVATILVWETLTLLRRRRKKKSATDR